MVGHRVFKMQFATLYPAYVAKVERKGRSTADLDRVICWLTGFSQAQLKGYLKSEATLEEFFATASLNAHADLITGSICGVKIQEIDDPLMKQIRQLDKLVDEVANGRPMEKILRAPKL